MIAIIGSLFASKFVYTDIYVSSSGVIRPATERTEIRSLVSGIVDSIFLKDGDLVEKDQLVIKVKDLHTADKLNAIDRELGEYRRYLHDLQMLTMSANAPADKSAALQSSVYKEQLNRHLSLRREKAGQLDKTKHDLQINSQLATEKIISPKEFYDIQHLHEQASDSYHSFLLEQRTSWQQDLAKYRISIEQLETQRKQVLAEASLLGIRAATSGSIQGLNDIYAGSYLQANQLVCIISPENGLMGECFVKSRDIGLLQKGQVARYQFSAFNYNYFGEMTGRVISIDKDFSIVNNTAVIKLRCSFDSSTLHLKNGYTGKLQKGLDFQANFFIARRSLWQLLFDKIDDWLNPRRTDLTTADNEKGY
ncbi:MAG: HlyD family secretion protein [Bacteroidetes bacterium]|nr:HlyD family secretion protein [Bacteroidota bacterium]